MEFLGIGRQEARGQGVRQRGLGGFPHERLRTRRAGRNGEIFLPPCPLHPAPIPLVCPMPKIRR
ncbi:hypothetical protein CLI64_10590 [Nostoc sp. CENA543]|nr:hypothetical protein CLI64_10590 [Nostoc sp. CENA543]